MGAVADATRQMRRHWGFVARCTSSVKESFTKIPVKITDGMVDKDKMGVAINFLPTWTPRKVAMEREKQVPMLITMMVK